MLFTPRSFCLSVILLLAADTSVHAQRKRLENAHQAGEDIYRHYSGTIGNKKVSADVVWGYQGGSNYGGSWYYPVNEAGQVHFSIYEPVSYDHGIPMSAGEETIDSSLTSDPDYSRKGSKLEFTMALNSFTGKRISAGNNTSATIDLKEDYSHSVAFDLRGEYRTSKTINSAPQAPYNSSFSLIAIPAATNSNEKAAFIKEAILKLCQINTVSTGEDFKYISKALCDNKYEEYTTAQNNNASAENAKNNFHSSVTILPVYNDNDLLVLKNTEIVPVLNEQKVRISVVCLDIKNLREIDLQNIFNDIAGSNKAAFDQIMEKEIRGRFKLSNTTKLSGILPSGNIPECTLFYPVHKGLIFHYPEGTLSAKKEFDLYIPYTRLSNLLNKDFLERVK
jgi:hypothetical protein